MRQLKKDDLSTAERNAILDELDELGHDTLALRNALRNASVAVSNDTREEESREENPPPTPPTAGSAPAAPAGSLRALYGLSEEDAAALDTLASRRRRARQAGREPSGPRAAHFERWRILRRFFCSRRVLSG